MYSLYTDGGARGNPGPAGIGFIILQDEKLIDFGAEFLGNSTNNYAEYTGLIKGLTLAHKLGIKDIGCKMDSELVVKQIRGEYKVKNEDLQILYEEALKLIKLFSNFSISHIERAHNKFADRLANIAMDAASK